NVDLEFASNVILPSIKETGRWAGEVMVKHKDGRVFPIWLTTSMVKDSKGNPIALIGIIRDITEQKRAEEELRFRSLLLDSATDSIFVHDLEGNMIYVNEAAYKTRGYTKEELMAMPLQRLDTPEYARLIGPRIESLLKTGSAVFESVHIKKDGSIMPIEVHTRIVEFGGRKVIASVVRDITERKRSEELSDALDNINAAINSTLNVSEIMQRVIVESTKAIGAETAGIDLREDGYWVIKYVYGLPEDFIGARFTDEDFKASALAARTKKLLVIDDARSDELANRELVERYGIRSMLIVPLVVRESAIGTLVFHYHSAQVPFTDTQVNFASKLGASISLALENARLYEAERNISDTLQEALLTAPERIEGVEFGYLYRSATEATRVGGDFYDLFEIEHGRVGIVIGDVSGKGLEAAALTSMVKNTIKAYAYEGASPASVMSRVNDMVKKASSSAVFVTVFFGILDTKEGTLFYCSAGHPPAILKREAGEIAFLITSSPVIGAFMGLNFIDDRATLKKGDVLILYTDGVTEARCDHEFFGEERLVSFIRDLEPTGAEKMPQVIFDEVMNCTGGVLSDDVALLCISVKGD
ncbi:MAG: SpoIIE family protein phosphatase, partial [Actinobacteria bacterium]|nr:SpoIIE family protein phosphatase [Actinomycetota bacterium]